MSLCAVNESHSRDWWLSRLCSNLTTHTNLKLQSHEMQHMYDFDKRIISGNPDKQRRSHNVDIAEIRGVEAENHARKIEKSKLRTSYGGIPINKDDLKNENIKP